MTELEKKERDDTINEVVDKTTDKVREKLMQPLTEEVAKMVSEEVSKQLPDRKFLGSGDNAKDALATKKEAADYLKGLYNKALTAGSAGNGEDLIPTFLSDEYIGVAQNYGLFEKRARKWPMAGEKQSIPTVSTATAYRIDTDGNRIATSQPGTGTVQLNSKTIGVIVPVSIKLLKNSSIDLVSALTYIMGKAQAKLIDQWGMLGLASGEGLFQNTSIPVYTLASGNTTYASLTAEDLLSTMETVDESFFETSAMSWLWSLGVFNNIRRLRSVVGSDKQGFLYESVGQPDVPGTVWGLPYDLSPMMPNNSVGSQAATKFAALVNWDEVVFGNDGDMDIEISKEATITDINGSTIINLFEQNMMAVKLSRNIDIQFSNPSLAHAVLKTAAS